MADRLPRRIVRTFVILLGMVLAAASLTACTAKTYASQCAYVVGSGLGDSHEIKDILLPYDTLPQGDDLLKMVPCNARNYVVSTNEEKARDRTTPVLARTGASELSPATEMSIQISAYWKLNQDRAVMEKFLPFCEKYTCFSTEGENEENENFASAGWNGMLAENFSPSLDRAVADALQGFGPGIWETREDWDDLEAAISENFGPELRETAGTDVDFFCASGAEGCAPVRFTIDVIEPKDPKVKEIAAAISRAQQEKSLSQAEGEANAAKLEAARARYGSLAEQYVGMLDVIAACGETTTCVVGMGSTPSVSVSGTAAAAQAPAQD